MTWQSFLIVWAVVLTPLALVIVGIFTEIVPLVVVGSVFGCVAVIMLVRLLCALNSDV